MKLKKKEDQTVKTLVLLRRGNKIPMGRVTVTKYEPETEGKAIQRPSHLGFQPVYNHIQLPNPDTIVDAKKCLLKGT